MPPEERNEAEQLERMLELDDARTADPSHLDDEYAFAGVKDPKVMLTTSRQPSSRLAQFAKEMRLCIPNCIRLNRGNMVVGEVVNVGSARNHSSIPTLNVVVFSIRLSHRWFSSCQFFATCLH